MRKQIQIGFILLLTIACRGPLVVQNHSYQLMRMRQDSIGLQKAGIAQIIQPYKQHLDSTMNDVLCVLDVTLKKENPVGSLGNMLCDELRYYTNMVLKKEAEICVYNNGGMRIPSIPAGPISLGKVYELLPFENTAVILYMKGSYVKELADFMAAQNGTPVSGMEFCIEQGKAVSIRIIGQELDTNRVYTVLTNDYMANGGDKYDMLKKAEKRIEVGMKVRDIMIEDFKQRGIRHIPLHATKDGRICIH